MKAGKLLGTLVQQIIFFKSLNWPLRESSFNFVAHKSFFGSKCLLFALPYPVSFLNEYNWSTSSSVHKKAIKEEFLYS